MPKVNGISFFSSYMRRNTASRLRFFLLAYVYVRSRRKSRALLVLLASNAKNPASGGVSGGGDTALRFGCVLSVRARVGVN